MDYKVIKSFKDKTDNKKLYKKGDSYSHSDDERIAFLIEKGFLEEKSKQPPENNELPSLETLKKLTHEELDNYAVDEKVPEDIYPKSGNKDEKATAINDFLSGE